MGENMRAVGQGKDLAGIDQKYRCSIYLAGQHSLATPAPCERNPPALLVKFTRGCSKKKLIKKWKIYANHIGSRKRWTDARMVRVSAVRYRPACSQESVRVLPARPGMVLSWLSSRIGRQVAGPIVGNYVPTAGDRQGTSDIGTRPEFGFS